MSGGPMQPPPPQIMSGGDWQSWLLTQTPTAQVPQPVGLPQLSLPQV
jgi:hypothetical protein